MADIDNSVKLTKGGCLGRQARLRERLRQLGLAGAILTQPGHVAWLTGYWNRPAFGSGVLVRTDGPLTLFTAIPAGDDAFADEFATFPGIRISLLVEDQPSELLATIATRLRRGERIGYDDGSRPWVLDAAGVTHEPLLPAMLELRRRKDADEIALLRRAIAGTEAAYAWAKANIVPGMREIDMYAQLKAAATHAVREPIGDFGNDFQAGNLGGPPRDRPMEAGELIPLDLSIHLRGYWSDMCRTYCVGGKPTQRQLDARKAVLDELAFVESAVKPGVSAKAMYQAVRGRLDGLNGWTFPHHLGHGVGVAVHEAPRLNHVWDDTFREGDFFTAEPGVYGPDLKGGIRIEQNYLVTATGVERLTTAPTDL